MGRTAGISIPSAHHRVKVYMTTFARQITLVPRMGRTRGKLRVYSNPWDVLGIFRENKLQIYTWACVYLIRLTVISFTIMHTT